MPTCTAMKNLMLIPVLFLLVLLQGCVAGTVIDVLAETVEAGVEVTGAVVGTAVDVIVPDGDDDED